MWTKEEDRKGPVITQAVELEVMVVLVTQGLRSFHSTGGWMYPHGST